MEDGEAIHIMSKWTDSDSAPTLEADAIHRIIDSSYIFYDFETRVNEKKEHIPNLCVAQKVKTRGASTYDESEIIDKVIFEGESCVHDFCEYLLRPENSGCTVIAHSQAGYDGKFILSWLMSKGKAPDKLIQQGSRVTYMMLRKII